MPVMTPGNPAAIIALLVQLYQPELLYTGPVAKVRSGKGFSGGGDSNGTVSPQGNTASTKA